MATSKVRPQERGVSAPLSVLLVVMCAAASLTTAAAAAAAAPTATAPELSQLRQLLTLLQSSGGATAASVSNSGPTPSSLLAQLNKLPAQVASAGSPPISVPASFATGLAQLLAAPASLSQLTALRAAGKLARFPAPYGRVGRCQEIQKTGLPTQVKACYCGNEAPWMHCDALMSLALDKAVSQGKIDAITREAAALTSGSAAAAATLPAPKRRSGRRLAQDPAPSCKSFLDLDTILKGIGNAIKNKCAPNIACGLTPSNAQWIKVTLNTKGCVPSMTAKAGSSVTYCMDGKCNSFDWETGSRWATAKPYFNETVTVGTSACLNFPLLTSALSLLGWNDAKDGCPGLGVGGSIGWSPLKQQLLMGSSASSGIKFTNTTQAGIWASIDGAVNYMDGAKNDACRQFKSMPSTPSWSCQPFCAWTAFQGRITATVGWKVLFLSKTKVIKLLNSPLPAC